MKKRKINISVLVILTFFTSLLITFLSYRFIFQTKVDNTFFDEAYESNQEIVSSAANFFDAKMDEEISSIIGVEVAHHNIVDEGVLFDENYYLTILSQQDYLDRIDVLSTDYEVLYSTNEDDNRVGLNLSEYYLFENIIDYHQLQVGKIVYNTKTDSLSLEVAYSGEDVVIVGLISIDFFKLYGDDFQSSFKDKELMILSNKGQYIYDSKNNYHLIQAYNYEMDKQILAAENSEIIEIDGEEVIIATDTLEHNDWKIIVYESADSALVNHSVVRNYYLYSTLFIFFSSIGLSTLLFALIHYSLRGLVHQMNLIKDGNFNIDVKETRIKELDNLITGFDSMKNEIQKNNKRLEFIAYHDELTGLGNRFKGEIDFEKMNKDEIIIFYYIDVNRFDVINENYGYQIGDKVLMELTSKLKEHFKQVYRMQSDEFLCIEYKKDLTDCIQVFEEVRDDISKGINVEDYKITLELQSGMAQFPLHDSNYANLVQSARIALNEVKLTNNKNYLCFSDIKEKNYLRISKIELLIKEALINKEFSTVYQPVIDMKTEKIRGFEALSRWESKELGVIRPDEFIPILEKLNQVHVLDELVLNRSIQLAKYIHDNVGEKIICSVNMSVETIMREDFTDIIDEAIDKYDFNPKYIELEITESTIVKDFKSIQAKMSYLRNKGVKFSEDDFGDAYSSLTYLTRLDIDTLKISRNFLNSILDSVESRVLVQTIVDLSHKLGFFTIVEGIENKKTFELFKEFDCDYCQGYYFYKPMKDLKLIDIIKDKRV